MNKSKKPSIRFKGFGDDWEQRKVGNVLLTLPFNQFLKEPEPDGKYEIIQQGNEPIIGYANGVPCSDYENTVIFGDHTLSLYKPKSPFFVATDGVRIVKGKSNLNGFYFMAILEKYKPQSEGYKRYYSILANQECYLTESANEQRKIGAFFEQLDYLITLHQRQHEKLVKFKKSMLEKMFPRDGEKVPEVRFTGFTGDWEQRKLGEVAISFEYGLNAAAKEYDGINKYIRITDIDDSSRAFRDDDLTSPDIELSGAEKYRLQDGDILFARTGASVGKSFIYRLSDGLVYFAGFLIRARIKPEHSAEFLFQSTLTPHYEQYINITSQRSGQPGVNAQEYADYPILLPKYEEQKKIGGFLHQLDSLISLDQRKIEKLQKIKKSCLEKMFV